MVYETLILTVPEITADESADLEQQLDQRIKKAPGSMRSFERWGKYKLAYPVWNNDYGVYFLARFDVDSNVSDLLKELESMFKVKYPQLVMRHMSTRLDPSKPLTYQKPESLEDMPTRDVDTFLRENKMEGLIKTAPQEAAASSGQAPEVTSEKASAVVESETQSSGIEE